ncbi:MAG: response regulator, partial [Stagnimonas sp.]|nr:response regulator [Stagnimonas sp.]
MIANTPIEILLVEDNPDDAEVTLRALKKHNLGNSVQWVKDGAEALHFLLGDGVQMAPDHIPRLILLDLRLPKIDGLEVLQRVKSDPRTKHIPV